MITNFKEFFDKLETKEEKIAFHAISFFLENKEKIGSLVFTQNSISLIPKYDDISLVVN